MIKAAKDVGWQLSGAKLRAAVFLTKFQEWADKSCAGIQIHITDRESFKTFRWGLALIAALHRLYPKDFSWRKGTYEFEDAVPAIDLLYGSAAFRTAVEGDSDLGNLEASICAFEKQYASDCKSYLLY